MKIHSAEIDLTLSQCKKLEKINELVEAAADTDNKGLCLANIHPGTHPDHKRIVVHFFPDKAAEAIWNFINLVAETIGHYEVEKNELQKK